MVAPKATKHKEGIEQDLASLGGVVPAHVAAVLREAANAGHACSVGWVFVDWREASERLVATVSMPKAHPLRVSAESAGFVARSPKSSEFTWASAAREVRRGEESLVVEVTSDGRVSMKAMGQHGPVEFLLPPETARWVSRRLDGAAGEALDPTRRRVVPVLRLVSEANED